jgi:F-type H+-transporting ATPase subunit a
MVISKKPLQFIAATLIAFLPLISIANPSQDSTSFHTEAANKTKAEVTNEEYAETPKDLKTEIKEYINHHLLDSYDFHLFSWKDDGGKDHHIGFPLPVILWDNGLNIFSSSKFHHGETAAESNGNYYRLYHNKIYKVVSTDEQVILDEHHHPTNAKPLDF